LRCPFPQVAGLFGPRIAAYVTTSLASCYEKDGLKIY
jgi:hypothetical protein